MASMGWLIFPTAPPLSFSLDRDCILLCPCALAVANSKILFITPQIYMLTHLRDFKSPGSTERLCLACSHPKTREGGVDKTSDKT